MKKTTLLMTATVAVLAFSSCKKQYTCDCTTVEKYDYDASSSFTDEEYTSESSSSFKDSKKNAEERCANRESSQSYESAGFYTYSEVTTCTLK